MTSLLKNFVSDMVGIICKHKHEFIRKEGDIMENKLEMFRNEEFGELTILEKDGKQYFGATEVAKSLGYNNPHDAIQRHCKEDGVVKHEVIDNMGRMQSKNFITEGNLYRLITHSKLPNAAKFETWIFDDVLPVIRKTGGYVASEQLFVDMYLPFADDVTKQLFSSTLKTIKEQNKLIGEMKPKAIFADAVDTAHTSILIGDLAKLINQNGINIGQNRLFKWLRENNYLIKKGERKNMPTQQSMDRGLFEVKERTINDPNGVTRITKTTKVTGKGQIYFINKFLSEVRA